MLRRMVGSSLKLRPVAPGPPQNNVSPESTLPSAASWKQQQPGELARRVDHAQLVAARGQHRARLQVAVGLVAGVDRVPQHAVLGMQQHRRVHRVAQRHRRVDVVVVAVGAHDGHHPAPPDAAAMGSWSWAASKISTSRWSPTSQMLLVTSHSPPSRAKMPSVVTSSMGTARSPSRLQHDDGAQHLAPFHLVEGLLHVLEANRLGHETIKV